MEFEMKSTRDPYFEQCLKGMTFPVEWEYTGYANDLCPSYRVNEKNLKIFIDHPDVYQREDLDMKRFQITNDNEMDENYQMTLLETDDFNEIIRFIDDV